MQNAPTQKFDYKRIYEYLTKQKNSISTLKLFFKNIDEYEKNSLKSIDEQQKELSKATTKITNKQIVKMLDNFCIHSIEKQQTPLTIRVITQKVTPSLTNAEEIITQLIQKARNLELQSKNKNLSQQQIPAFRQQLQNDIAKVYELRELALSTYAHTLIKNNCHQIEKLTERMQNQLQKTANTK